MSLLNSIFTMSPALPISLDSISSDWLDKRHFYLFSWDFVNSVQSQRENLSEPAPLNITGSLSSLTWTVTWGVSRLMPSEPAFLPFCELKFAFITPVSTSLPMITYLGSESTHHSCHLLQCGISVISSWSGNKTLIPQKFSHCWICCGKSMPYTPFTITHRLEVANSSTKLFLHDVAPLFDPESKIPLPLGTNGLVAS